MALEYLHTMIRVRDLDAALGFFSLLGLEAQPRWGGKSEGSDDQRGGAV